MGPRGPLALASDSSGRRAVRGCKKIEDTRKESVEPMIASSGILPDGQTCLSFLAHSSGWLSGKGT
jgi:hypothetical protein